jgi:hypothetical protein
MMRSLFVPMAMLVAFSVPTGAKPLEKLEYKNDRVTMRAEDTPLADIIDALKRQSGAELHGTAPERNVTLNLDDVPLREALERLLGEQSFALTYGDQNKLKKLELRGGPVAAKGIGEKPAGSGSESASAPSESMNLGIHDGKTPAHWVAVHDGLRANVPVSGRLREAAGGERASWDFVLSTASQRKDPELRNDAIRAGVHAVENDPEMREGVIGSLLRMNDEQLAGYIKAMARSVEEEPIPFMKSVVRHSRDSELRSRARELLRQFRAEERASGKTA